MNRDLLLKRLSEIEKSIEDKNKIIHQAMADLNVFLGCKTECQYWLKQLNGVTNIKQSNVINETTMTLDELKDYLGADKLEVINN